MVSSSNRAVGTAEIIAAVGKYFGIPKEDLLGKSRKKELSTPRQITIFLMRENTNRSLPEIGKLMGGKDHTTIMYSEKKIRDLLKTDVTVKSDIEKIREDLFSTLNM
jgi:chromosomal replication initiator protein